MYVISSIIIIFFIVALVMLRNYEKEFIISLKKREHPLRFLYPLILFSMQKLHLEIVLQRNKKVDKSLQQLYVNDVFSRIKREYYLKKISNALLLFLSIQVICILYQYSIQNNNSIIQGNILPRNHNNLDQVITFNARIKDKNNASEFSTSLELHVNPYYGTKEENSVLCSRAAAKIEETILGENSSCEEIRYPLIFLKTIPTHDLVITWRTQDEAIITKEGEVRNDVLTRPTPIVVYGDIYKCSRNGTTNVFIGTYQKKVQVLAYEWIQQQDYIKGLRDEIEKIDKQTRSQHTLTLPSQYNGKQIEYTQEQRSLSWLFLFIGTFLPGLLFASYDKKIKGCVEKRNREMILDYPDIINKFTLLIGAGMTLSGAWNKIATDYLNLLHSKNTHIEDKRYAYEEMLRTSKELELGISEQEAFSNFGRRVGLSAYLKFSTLVIQNLKKGTSGLLILLETESLQAFAERKELAKKMGEEASTKLLLPMFIILGVVMAVIMIPAFMSMQL